jgi:hypothetical protein
MRTLLLLVVLVLFCPSLSADQLTLKNGDRLTGSIERSDAKTLIIKTEFEREVSVQWPAIDNISSSEPLHVELQGGQMLVGPVNTVDGRIQTATQTAGQVLTKLNDWLGWQITFADNYFSNPPFGIKGNDLRLSTGLLTLVSQRNN